MSVPTPLGKPISVRLPESMRLRVEALAKATRRSQGDIVREVLERELTRLEWEQRMVARVADLRSGLIETVPLEDLEAELGMAEEPVDMSVLDHID